MSVGISPKRQAELLRSMGVPDDKASRIADCPSVLAADAKQATRRRGRMNKLEAKFAAQLEALRLACIVKDWKFEPVKFCIADGEQRAWYTPDFMVEYEGPQGVVFVEIKGFWREAARLRIKVAAAQYPMFKFRSMQPRKAKNGGGWKIEMFSDESF